MPDTPPRAPSPSPVTPIEAEPAVPPPRRVKRVGSIPSPHGTTRRTMLRPEQIIRDPAFRFRRSREDAHVRSLMQARRSGATWDPIVVWEEEDGEGRRTGRLVLLDGDHRLAAHASIARKSPRCGDSIAATIVSGDRDVALRWTLEGNAKATLPLTPPERADAAWRLVCDPLCGLTIAETARLTGTGTTRVSDMRRRLTALRGVGREPTGAWFRDRQDGGPAYTPQAMTPAEVRRKIADRAQAHRKIMSPAPRLEPAQEVEAFARAMGYRAFQQAVADYFGGPDEFAHHLADSIAEAARSQDADLSAGDF